MKGHTIKIIEKQILNKLTHLLSHVDTRVYESYNNKLDTFIHYVNNAIEQREDLSILIGLNPFSLVEMNHANHANFMYTIFVTKDVQSMHDTYIWAYQTYHAKGFNFRYFYLELTAWRESFVLEDKEVLAPIIEIYNYLILLHDYFVQHATSTAIVLPEIIDENIYSDFLKAILKPDMNESIALPNTFIQKDEDIKSFWETIILPSLYSVGNKWANAEISVGEEHTATSICQRVMSEHYSKILKHVEGTKKILIATSPNELHEVGARMLADILELNGYDVTFLSSHSTTKEKLDVIEFEEIDFVVISTTLVSNIIKTQEIVTQIREKFKAKCPTIIIGGQAFIKNSDSDKLVQADYVFQDVNEILELLKRM